MFHKLCRLKTDIGKLTGSIHLESKLSCRDMHCRKIVFDEFGDPARVARLVDGTLPDKPENKQVLVKMIVAPVNPSDINTIQGVYPIKPLLPSTPGFEGIGEVVAVGPAVEDLVPGDRVITNGAIGSWCTAGVFDSNLLWKVSQDIDVYALSGILSNPCTAYRMLHDFVSLNKDDVVIQNGANSACGQNVIQLAKILGYRSVNVIRKRPEPDLENLKNYLKSLGATYVITEEELRTTDLFKSGCLPKPRLGLNCVGGKSATEVLRSLNRGGVMVTYGGMSREPVIVPTASFIFNDIKLKGFWMTRWRKENVSSDKYTTMFDDLSRFMRDGRLVAPAHKILPLDSFQEILQNTISPKGFIGFKYYIDLQN